MININKLKEKKYNKPYIIAEAGVNHENDINKAFEMISSSAENGADAIKFQAYKAETLASRNSPAYWDTKKETTDSQYKLFKRFDKFWKKEFELLKIECDKKNIDFLCTPFDFESANFLNDLCETIKISSSDLNNLPFIEHICKFKKNIILSTGASTFNEINKTVDLINNNNIECIILHCVLNYPTKNEDANLMRIKTLQEKFPNQIIGYSDHTLPNEMNLLIQSWLLGAKVIEKHYTFDKNLLGNDHYHAMDKIDLKIFVKKIDDIIKIIGDGQIDSKSNEVKSRENARRSLVYNKDLNQGSVIKHSDITFKRPGTGISPDKYNIVIGKVMLKNTKKDEILDWNDFEND